jgi:hypothetical protein
MPIATAETAQMVAAVVIPFTRFSYLNITTAPKKPMPVTNVGDNYYHTGGRSQSDGP